MIEHSEDPSSGDRRHGKQPKRAAFAMPLGSVTSGRLVFASGASVVSLDSEPALGALYSARFDGEIPGVAAADGVVTIRYRLNWPLGWLLDWRGARARVVLNSSILWEVEFHHGVSKLVADLRGLRLRSLDLASAASARIMLPRPSGGAYIHLGGSAGNVVIQRPAGIGVQFVLDGSGSRLTLDGERLRPANDGLRWRSSDYRESADRYEVTVSGSVSKLTVSTG